VSGEVVRRLATVTAVDAGTGYATTAEFPVPLPCLASYPALVGDVVLVDLYAGTGVVLGRAGVPGVPVSADVATSQTTASGSYVNLATAGPAVTLDLGIGQVVRVEVSATIVVSATTGTGYMSYEVSGVESAAAADVNAAKNANTNGLVSTRPSLYVAAVAGSHTLTAKYRTGSGVTGTFIDRRIIAQPF